MKPHLDIEHEGTLGSDNRTRMTFDENSSAFLMQVLTDLYSDPAMAVIREYSTNARDSHIKAGRADVPIMIETPNNFNPVFTVTDTGVGMSVDEIENFFSKYGASSKRDSDNEAGMLGLGCKSGLSYSSQFTMISIRGGVKATVLITRESDGGGTVQIIDTVSTDEPNGVQVRVPVADSSKFNYKVIGFFKFWDPGTVMIDGKEPAECLWTNPKNVALDEDLVLCPALGLSYIVMGNVPYRIKDGVLPKLTVGGVIARVPIGTVNFTPSREDLMYTKRTNETLGDITEYVTTRTLRMAQEAIDAEPGYLEAHKTWTNWKPIINTLYGHWGEHSYNNTQWMESNKGNVMTYRGELFPGKIKMDAARTMSMALESRYSNDMGTRVKALSINEAHQYLFHIIGYGGTAVSGIAKKRIRAWYQEHKDEFPKSIQDGMNSRVLVYPRKIDTPWFESIRYADWDEIKKTRLPEDDKSGVVKSKYRLVVSGTQLSDAEDISGFNVTSWIPANSKIDRGQLAAWTGPHTCAVVMASDIKKFQREHPTILELRTHFVITAAPWLHGLTDSQKLAICKEESWPSCMPKVTELDRICDPELKQLVRLRKEADTLRTQIIDKYRKITNLAAELGLNLPEIVAPPFFTELYDLVIDRYPLLNVLYNAISHHGRATLFDYLNSMYLVRQGMHLIPVY